MFVRHRCPRRQQSQNMAKISKSYILTLPHPQGHVMSVKCEEPIDELTVQVWLVYQHPNFKYCTLFVSGTELRTDRQTDRHINRQADDPITRCPRRTFQAGGTKISLGCQLNGSSVTGTYDSLYRFGSSSTFAHATNPVLSTFLETPHGLFGQSSFDSSILIRPLAVVDYTTTHFLGVSLQEKHSVTL